MVSETSQLPNVWQIGCYITTLLALSISIYCIFKQLINYRKPYEQRLVIRILLLVPIFCITCLAATIKPQFSRIYLDFIREFYEAFVIYTFFSYLTLILGGERLIMTKLTMGKKPIRHVLPFMGDIDLSNPYSFLLVKRGILQYVWFKPFYCLAMLICQIWTMPKFETWLLILYNVSVTWSLYNLALFWKCLYEELKKYNPWSKFMCVKLIIFASYWQGMLIKFLSIMGKFSSNDAQLLGYVYENGMLCLEMIGFSILHMVAFPWSDYSIKIIPNGARIKLYYSIRDCFGCLDLIWDFKQTLFQGDTYYNFKNFTPEESNTLIHDNNINTTYSRLNKGFRFTNGGNNAYWINYGSINDGHHFLQNENRHTNDSAIKNESWEQDCFNKTFIPDDNNCPVVWDFQGHKYSRNMKSIRDRLSTNSINDGLKANSKNDKLMTNSINDSIA